MTPQEKQDVKRTSRVIRAARKLSGYSQRKIADLLEVSQAALSKYENGIMMPSTSQWFRLCQEFGIDSESSYKTGFIDNCLPGGPESTYPHHSFRMPNKFLRHQGSKVRTVQPIFKYFEEVLGEEKLEEYLIHSKIDPDFFAVFDNQLNIRFGLELITWLIQNGHLNLSSLDSLTKTISSPEVHGRMHEHYRHATSPRQLLSEIVSQVDKYETNFRYQFVDEQSDKMVLSIAPTTQMKYFDYKSETLGNFLCEYKKHYFKKFSTYTGAAAVEIHELECHFHRNKRCLYEIKLKN